MTSSAFTDVAPNLQSFWFKCRITRFYFRNLEFKILLCKIAVHISILQILRVISQPRPRPLCTRHTVIWSRIPWFHLSTILFHELISSVENRPRLHFVFGDIGFDCFHGYCFHRHIHRNWLLRGSKIEMQNL